MKVMCLCLALQNLAMVALFMNYILGYSASNGREVFKKNSGNT